MPNSCILNGGKTFTNRGAMLAPTQTTWVALGQVCHNINKPDARGWKYPQVIKALEAAWLFKKISKAKHVKKVMTSEWWNAKFHRGWKMFRLHLYTLGSILKDVLENNWSQVLQTVFSLENLCLITSPLVLLQDYSTHCYLASGVYINME